MSTYPLSRLKEERTEFFFAVGLKARRLATDPNRTTGGWILIEFFFRVDEGNGVVCNFLCVLFEGIYQVGSGNVFINRV